MSDHDGPVHYLVYVYVEPPPQGDAIPTSLCPGGRSKPDPLTISIQDTTCPDCLAFILRIGLSDAAP